MKQVNRIIFKRVVAWLLLLNALPLICMKLWESRLWPYDQWVPLMVTGLAGGAGLVVALAWILFVSD